MTTALTSLIRAMLRLMDIEAASDVVNSVMNTPMKALSQHELSKIVGGDGSDDQLPKSSWKTGTGTTTA